MPQTRRADWKPSDWPESLQELRRIDNLLRCSICKEYFDTAVLFQECSHNYCSLCIRKAMVYNPQCPTCFEKASGSDLKCNRILDELVKNFISVRSKLLDIINKVSVQSVSEKKDEAEISDNSASNFEKIFTPRRHRRYCKTKTRKGKSPCPTPGNKRKRPRLIDSDSEDNDGEDVMEPQAMEIDPVKSPGNNSQPMVDAAAPASFVECPVCAEFISSNAINSHLDFCLVSGEKKSSLRSHKKAKCSKEQNKEPTASSSSMKTPVKPDFSSSSSTSCDKMTKEKTTGANTFISAGPKRKPIPGTVYAILSEKQLKQKLKEWNLSTKGDRKTLIKRHQEFVVAYNAQCDSVNPKSVSAIIKELEIKEKRKTSNLLNATSTGPNLNLNRDASEEEVDKVHKQYLQENKNQFEKLIDQIRKRKKQGNTSADKSTSAVVVIDELDSESDQGTESINVDQLHPQNQELNNDSSVDDQSEDASHSFLDLGSSSQIQSKKQKSNSRSSVVNSQQVETGDSEDQNNQQLQTEDPRNNQNNSESVPAEILGQDECPALQGNEKRENQVPDPPLMSNLASINESNSSNEESGDVKDDDGDGRDDTDDGGDSDETEDNDQNWELTPSFGILSSDEEYNEDEDGESDEDLFATKPLRPATKTRSLRRKKK